MTNPKPLHYEDSLNEINRLNQINQLILDSVAEGIYGIDLNARVVFGNKAAERLTGYCVQEYEHHTLHELIHHTNSRGEQVPLSFCSVYHALTHGESLFIKDDVFWRKDGSYFPVEYTAKPMMENGTHIGSVITFRDMTEKLRTDQLIVEWDKLSAVGQLAAGIAHEIRNPITALKGFLKLMQRSGQVNDGHITIMGSEFERIECIIQELLTFSKPCVSQYNNEEIGDIIRHVVTLMEPQALLKNIALSMESACLPLYIRCIKNQIKQVLVNLIRNAIEAMDKPDGSIQIKISHQTAHVIIEVIDNGPGIPERALNKLGEPFYSTKEKGTGLGLMVTQNIIRNNHHGILDVKSQEGIGSIFAVILPQV
ncbi:ATP-binding protein [Paenibacillus mesotrionivorans]|uniref:ATP-binding protein n=1 Tax=Paenibacillus mesotrionivorans TaxID=3160968 RepID=UPI003A10036E